MPYKGANTYIDSALQLSDKLNKYKCLSQLYKYNSTLGYLLLNLSAKARNKSMGSLGYDPQYGNICNRAYQGSAEEPAIGSKKFKVDSLKIKYILNTIAMLRQKKINLLVTFTPIMDGQASIRAAGWESYFNQLKNILKANQVHTLDLSNSADFKSCDLFFDHHHLNHSGADKFTMMVAEYLKSNTLLNKN